MIPQAGTRALKTHRELATPSCKKTLKSQPTNTFTTENDYRADFWEFSYDAAASLRHFLQNNSRKWALKSLCTFNVVAHWLLRNLATELVFRKNTACIQTQLQKKFSNISRLQKNKWQWLYSWLFENLSQRIYYFLTVDFVKCLEREDEDLQLHLAKFFKSQLCSHFTG